MTDFAHPEELEQLRAEALRFAAAELAPAARASERAGAWPDQARAVLEQFGLRELDLPESLGGLGPGARAKVVLLEALASGDAGGLAAADPLGLSLGALLACPDRARARELASACLAGAARAALLVLDPDGPRPGRVPWAPSPPAPRFAWESAGSELRLLELAAPPEPVRALAFQASGGVSVPLAGARLLGEWRLTTQESVALRGRARLWAAAVALGVAQAAFDATVAYARERIVFGKAVAHHQGNAFELAVAATNLHGARLLVQDAASCYDCGAADAGFWATQAWLGAMDAAVPVTDLGIQLLGGHGFLVDHLAEKRFREVRMLALLAGGRDAAEADAAELVLDVPDPLFPSGEAAP
ncbi:MAG TPA: acyl-CoA dehydrogenase family protein [Myxococcota bacterium]|nr:acyl-CoA dehydrogenase family protein [Myxococcota bacterium]